MKFVSNVAENPGTRIEAATVRGCEKMGTVPSADRIGSIESVNLGGAKWTVPDFFTAPQGAVSRFTAPHPPAAKLPLFACGSSALGSRMLLGGKLDEAYWRNMRSERIGSSS